MKTKAVKYSHLKVSCELRAAFFLDMRTSSLHVGAVMCLTLMFQTNKPLEYESKFKDCKSLKS